MSTTNLGRRVSASLVTAAVIAATAFAASPAMAGPLTPVWVSEPDLLGDLTIGDEVSRQLEADDAVSFNAADAAAEELGLDVSSDGLLTGYVTGTPGEYSFGVNAVSSSDVTATQTFTGALLAADITPVWNTDTLADGTVGSEYYVGFNVPNAVSYTVGEGVPAGLVVEADHISGTPTESGDFTFTVTAVGSDDSTADQVFNLHINDVVVDSPWVTTQEDLEGWEQDLQVHQQLDVPGATAIRFDEDSNTYGLSIVNEDGDFYLDGVFDTYGGWGITLIATVDGEDYTQTFYGEALRGLPNFAGAQEEFHGTARVGEEFSSYIVTNNADELQESGDLPDGLEFTSDGGMGVVSGTPTEAGTFNFKVSAANSRYQFGEDSPFNGFQINVKAGLPVVDEYNLGNLVVGQKINHKFTGTNVDFWDADGTLPAGLTFNRDTATLSGTVEYGDEAYDGYYDFAIVGSQNRTEDTDEQHYIGTVQRYVVGENNPTITSATLPEMTQGAVYSYQLTADQDVKWEVSSGYLPAGITLSKSGLLSGTPEYDGKYEVTVTAFNDEGSVSKDFEGIVKPSNVVVDQPGGTNNGTVVAGTTITVSGSGFSPDSDVTVVLRSNPVTLGSFTADSNGKVVASVKIPLNTPAGTHHLYFVDENGVEYLISEITVAAAGDSTAVIPGLGFEGAPYFGVAALMLLGGAALMVRRRKVAAA